MTKKNNNNFLQHNYFSNFAAYMYVGRISWWQNLTQPVGDPHTDCVWISVFDLLVILTQPVDNL